MNSIRRFFLLLLLSILIITGAVGCELLPQPTPPSVTLFWEPDLGRGPLLRLISKAQHELDITMYLFTDEALAQALERAVRRGVEVRLLLEMHPFGGSASNERMARRLKQAGIHVRPTNPAFRYTHEKSMIVDGTTGVIMTLNWTRSAFSRNREFGVIFHYQPWVKEMRAVFEADWHYQIPPRLKEKELVWSPVNARERILAFIREAREELLVEHESLGDSDVVEALTEAAQRHVRVRLIGPPPREDDYKAWLQRYDLVRAGVHVRLLENPYPHAKVLVADRRQALVGSTNLTLTSLEFNRELSVFIRDPSALSSLLDVLEEDWKHAVPVNPNPPPRNAISPADALRYVGKVVTVEGKVVHTYDTGKVTFLDFTRDKKGLSVVIFARDYGKFPAPPASYYHNRHIRVRGKIRLYKGAPEIIVHSPDEIEIIK